MFQTCPKCSRECSTDTPVCPRCGHRYFGEPRPATPSPPPAPWPENASEPEHQPPPNLIQTASSLYRLYDTLQNLVQFGLFGLVLLVLAVFAFTGFGAGRVTASDIMYGVILALMGVGVFALLGLALFRGPRGVRPSNEQNENPRPPEEG